jgi:hypothetical protein
LELVHSDELTFALWRSENPHGTVLRSVNEFAPQYETKDWEDDMRKMPTVIDTTNTGRNPRELMLGVEHNGAARAYVLDRLLKQKLVQDIVGGTPIIVLVGPDDKSIRVFEASVQGHDGPPEFYRQSETNPNKAILMDSASGSGWTFRGCAITGPATGQCLKPIPALKDYWFDWQLYHPNTTVHNK